MRYTNRILFGCGVIVLLYLVFSWIFASLLLRPESPPHPSCRVNLVHILDDGAKGSKPICLASIRGALHWAQSRGLLFFSENAPLSTWKDYTFNLVMNFQCDPHYYNRLNFSFLLVPSALEISLNYSNIGLWSLAWDQISTWGCSPSSYFYQHIVEPHLAEIHQTMQETVLLGEISSHFAYLRSMSRHSPLLLPTVVPDTEQPVIPYVEKISSKVCMSNLSILSSCLPSLIFFHLSRFGGFVYVFIGI